MKKIFLPILFVLYLTGCSLSAQGKAIVTANSIHEIAATENQVINSYCTPKYQAAKTKADVDATDKVCLPARTSYFAVKAAWSVLMGAIQANKAGTGTEQQIQIAAQKLGEVLADLQKIVETMK